MSLAAARVGGGNWFRDAELSEFMIYIGTTQVYLKLESTGRQRSKGEGRIKDVRLKLSTPYPEYVPNSKSSWEDDATGTIEERFSDIFAEIGVYAELQLRKAHRDHRDELARRECARLAEVERLRSEEERERQEKAEAEVRKRRETLLAEARAFREAEEIREYVNNVRSSISSYVSEHNLDVWSKWALNEADEIDPITSGRAESAVAGFVKS